MGITDAAGGDIFLERSSSCWWNDEVRFSLSKDRVNFGWY